MLHDHNTLNYNKKFHFENIECGQHISRDLQKNSDDTQHKWSTNVKKLTAGAMKDRSREIKSHMKISGQFESVEAAEYHALIKTYTETRRRNGINEIGALKRLCDGNPYTVQEIICHAHFP